MKGERRIHFYWKYQEYPKIFRLTDGREITVIRPGDYQNRGQDFQNAMLEIDGKTKIGAVEIHICESDWKVHAHHLNQNYAQTLLHVFLEKSPIEDLIPTDKPMLSLQLDKTELEDFLEKNKVFKSEKLPGACGFTISPQKYPRLKKLIVSAAEERIFIKAEEILEDIRKEPKKTEEFLFRKIFRSLGYTGFSDEFEQLARILPLESLLKRVRQGLVRESIILIFSQWVKTLGWEEKAKEFFGEEESFIIRLMQACRNLPNELCLKKDSKDLLKQSKTSNSPYRNANNPWFRLFAMYFHLYAVKENGLIQSWLRRIDGVQFPEKGKNVKLTDSRKLFEFKFQEIIPKKTHATKVGDDKLLIVWINAIIPFFIAYAQSIGEKELEKRIVKIFLNLPAEGQNSITKHMEARLGIRQLPDLNPRKNSSYHQGLIQIHCESCQKSFPSCENCSFLNLLK